MLIFILSFSTYLNVFGISKSVFYSYKKGLEALP